MPNVPLLERQLSEQPARERLRLATTLVAPNVRGSPSLEEGSSRTAAAGACPDRPVVPPPGRVRRRVERKRLPGRAQRPVAGVPVLNGRRVVSRPLAALPDEELTLLDLADRLLNRGVVITGEATISVAGVDLVYLGLNLILAAVETIEQRDARRK